MLLEMAIGDSFGIGYEFCDDTPRPTTLTGYIQNARYPEIIPGTYTDDTQRAIANADVILNRDPFNARDYANAYVDTFKLDPRVAYSKRYQRLLEDSRSGDDLLLNIKRSATSNGSIMGVAVLGYLPTIAAVKLAADVQAITTHSSETTPYARAIALSAYYFLHDLGPKADLPYFLDLEVDWGTAPSSWLTNARRRTTMQAYSTYQNVMLGLHLHNKLSDLLLWCIAQGGDTDSLAAICLALASCDSQSDEFENDLPKILYRDLETGSFGIDLLRNLNAQLHTRFGKSRS